MNHIFSIVWLIFLAVIVTFFGGRKFIDVFRNLGGGGRGGGPHPLPATGTVESSRGAANPKESKASRPGQGLVNSCEPGFIWVAVGIRNPGDCCFDSGPCSAESRLRLETIHRVAATSVTRDLQGTS